MTPKRGRKKGSKNKTSGEPHNFAFWKLTLKSPEEVNAYLERGSDKQKNSIKEILEYLKRAKKDLPERERKYAEEHLEFFEKINGEETLKELK